MQLPIVTPAPVVTAYADAFRDLFENRCQFRHFQHYLTGLIVLDNKSLSTKIDLGIDLIEAAIRHKVPFSVLLFDSWYRAEELVSMARSRKKDGSSPSLRPAAASERKRLRAG